MARHDTDHKCCCFLRASASSVRWAFPVGLVKALPLYLMDELPRAVFPLTTIGTSVADHPYSAEASLSSILDPGVLEAPHSAANPPAPPPPGPFRKGRRRSLEFWARRHHSKYRPVVDHVSFFGAAQDDVEGAGPSAGRGKRQELGQRKGFPVAALNGGVVFSAVKRSVSVKHWSWIWMASSTGAGSFACPIRGCACSHSCTSSCPTLCTARRPRYRRRTRSLAPLSTRYTSLADPRLTEVTSTSAFTSIYCL